MKVGTKVIVWVSLTGGWSAGFEIAERRRDENGKMAYRLLRASDNSILPSWFTEDKVRAAMLNEQPNEVFLDWRERVR